MLKSSIWLSKSIQYFSSLINMAVRTISYNADTECLYFLLYEAVTFLDQSLCTWNFYLLFYINFWFYWYHNRSKRLKLILLYYLIRLFNGWYAHTVLNTRLTVYKVWNFKVFCSNSTIKKIDCVILNKLNILITKKAKYKYAIFTFSIKMFYKLLKKASEKVVSRKISDWREGNFWYFKLVFWKTTFQQGDLSLSSNKSFLCCQRVVTKIFARFAPITFHIYLFKF